MIIKKPNWESELDLNDSGEISLREKPVEFHVLAPNHLKSTLQISESFDCQNLKLQSATFDCHFLKLVKVFKRTKISGKICTYKTISPKYFRQQNLNVPIINKNNISE